MLTIEELKVAIDELTAKREALREEALVELDNDNLEKAQELRAQIKEIDAELVAKKAELEAAEEAAEDTEEETPAVEEEDRSLLQNENTEGEKRNMEDYRAIVEGKPELSEEVRSFRDYLLTGEERAGITTDSGAVIVPDEVVTTVIDLTDAVVSLDKLVRVRPVKNKKGSLPVLNVENDNEPLPSVAELAANPELAVQDLTDIDYNIATYRGYLRISRETLEDAINAEQILRDVLANKIVTTRNAHILAVLNEQVATDAASADDIKTILNTVLKPKYNKQLIMSQSAYNSLDQLKDGNGRYLLQDSISVSSGKVLFGKEVIVFEDALIGANTIFAGDISSAVILFDRSQYQAKWTDYMHFGECLMVAVRHDVKPLDTSAVVKINFVVPAGV